MKIVGFTLVILALAVVSKTADPISLDTVDASAVPAATSVMR